MHEIQLSKIIDKLWMWTITGKDSPALKDTTRIGSVKFDFYLESSMSDPMSYTVFELSEKGELIVDDVSRLMESKAAYFLFVNTDKNFVIAIKNTLENCKKLVQDKKIENLKIKIVN